MNEEIIQFVEEIKLLKDDLLKARHIQQKFKDTIADLTDEDIRENELALEVTIFAKQRIAEIILYLTEEYPEYVEKYLK